MASNLKVIKKFKNCFDRLENKKLLIVKFYFYLEQFSQFLQRINFFVACNI